MNRKKMPVFILMIALVLICLTGCSGKDDAVESWAYNFDETKEILRLNADGTAMYMEKYFEEGIQKSREKKYTSYKKDDNYITLTGSDGELKLRYETTDSGIQIYEKSTYVYTPNEEYERNGIIGVWTNVGTDRLYYEFSEGGNFCEDGIFVGNYLFDVGDGAVRLVYYDEVPDTIMYYEIQGDEMIVEYPWMMVPTKKD